MRSWLFPIHGTMFMKIRLFILFFSVLSVLCSAQSRPDSLRYIWQNVNLPDSTRLIAVDALCKMMVKEMPDSAFSFAQAALQLARKTQNKKAQAQALAHIGMSWRLRSDLPKAIKSYEQSIYLLERTGDQGALSDLYRYLSDVYRLQSNFPQAIEYVQQSLSLAEAIGDQGRVADAYVCFSSLYYMSSDNLDQVESYLLKAKPLYEAMQKEEGLVFVYSNLSLVDYERRNYPAALQNIKKCIAIQERKGDVFGLATSLQNRATIYTELGLMAEAKADYIREVAIFEKIGDQEGLSDAYSCLGNLSLKQNQSDEAIKWCFKALTAARALGPQNLKEQEACQCLSEAYKRVGNHQKALEYMIQFTAIKDSIQNQQTEKQLKLIEIELDSLNQATIALKKKQAFDRTIRQKNRTVGILVAFLVLGALIAWAIWTRMLYFKRKSLDMQIRSETMAKQQLINEIALLKTQVNPHFLFNSLSILSSLIHKNTDLSEQFIEQLARSYRYILEQKDQVLVSLRTELEFIQSYSFLLKIRFEHKFDLDLDIPDTFKDQFRVAPLTLQLLIENAVKHNRMSAREPLIVQVRVRQNYLEVRNKLRPRGEQVNSTGVGLENIMNRYALLCNEPVWAGEQEGDFVVRVPLVDR